MKWIDRRLQLVEDGLMMAKGRIGDVVYYVRDGRQCRRKLGNMTGQRWYSDPRFANSQGASREFGAVGKLSTAIRKGLGPCAKMIGGSRELHPRLTAAFLKKLKHFPGQRGSRDLPAERILSSLDRFVWSKRGKPGIIPYAFTRVNYEPISLKPRVDFEYLGHGHIPGWATHIRPVCIVVAISDMRVAKDSLNSLNGGGNTPNDSRPRKKSYAPIHRKLHGQMRRVEGPEMSVHDYRHPLTAGQTLAWRPDLIFPEAVKQGLALLVVVGIEGLIYNTDGSLHDTQMIAMQTAYTGKVHQSIAEERVKQEYAALIAPYVKQYKELIEVPYAAYLARITPQTSPSEKGEFWRDCVNAMDVIWKGLLEANGIGPPGGI